MCLPKTWHASISPFKFTVMISVNLLLGDVEKRRRRIHARAVHQNIHAAELRQHVGQQLLQAGLGGRVARKKFRLAAALGDFVQPLLGLGRVAADNGTAAPAVAKPSAISPHNTPVPPMTTATLPFK